MYFRKIFEQVISEKNKNKNKIINDLKRKGEAIDTLFNNDELLNWVDEKERKKYVYYNFQNKEIFYYLGNTKNEAKNNPNSIGSDKYEDFDIEQLKYFLNL